MQLMMILDLGYRFIPSEMNNGPKKTKLACHPHMKQSGLSIYQYSMMYPKFCSFSEGQSSIPNLKAIVAGESHMIRLLISVAHC